VVRTQLQRGAAERAARRPPESRHRPSGIRANALGAGSLLAKDPKFGYSTINARAEEVATKPAYREALKKRRCLVPADAFYEWRRIDKKTKHPFAFALKSGEPYAMAGLWERWQPKEGEPLETFTILTTDPNELMEPVHNRMPVILAADDYDRWLEPGGPPSHQWTCSALFQQKRCFPGQSASALATSATTIRNCSRSLNPLRTVSFLPIEPDERYFEPGVLFRPQTRQWSSHRIQHSYLLPQ